MFPHNAEACSRALPPLAQSRFRVLQRHMSPPQDLALRAVYNESDSPLHDERYSETNNLRSIFAKRPLRVTLVVFMTIVYGELQPERYGITTEACSFSRPHDMFFFTAWAAILLDA